MNPGIAFAIGAYLLWGVFPIYFKALQDIPPLEILAHRIVWSLLVCVALLLLLRHGRWLLALLRRPKVLLWFSASATAVAVNWFVYIWAVNAGRVIDASLGYFINPLVNVLIGALVLHEKLRAAQWAAVAVATGGVLWLTALAGGVPWIGLVLAFSWGAYALLRKTAVLGAIEGLTLETVLLVPIAAGYLYWLGQSGHSNFGQASLGLQLLLAASGPVTAVPLLLFAAGARRIPLSTLGVLQYIAPSLQLLIGVLLYGEPFGRERVIGYGLIWVALAIFTGEGLWRSWQSRAAAR